MINENEMKLEFLSKSNNEAFARITVAAFVASLDPTIEEISDIKTAVSEADACDCCQSRMFQRSTPAGI